MAKNEDRKFTVKPVEEGDLNKVIELLKITFYVDEPINEALDLAADHCAELDDYCTASVFDGFTYKAVDDDGNIVGVTISGKLVLDETYETEEKYNGKAERCENLLFKRVFYVLASRERGARLMEKYPGQTLLEVKVAATHPQWRNLGIMNALVKETETAAKENGINLIRMDTSSAYSAKSAERQGFTCVHEALYSEIRKDGEALVVPKAPHLYDRVFIKDLRN